MSAAIPLSSVEHGTVRVSRRDFLTASALATTCTLAGPLVRTRAAESANDESSAARDVLVVVFLRGGMDGLSLCVPHGDDALYSHREKLAIRPPKSGGGAVDLDGFFALAPAAKALVEPYRRGQLAFVHAAGLRHPTRSHFDAMNHMEHGTVVRAPHGSPTGWIARMLEAKKTDAESVLRAVAIERFLPTALAGATGALAIPDPRAFSVLAREPLDRSTLASMYDGERGAGHEIARRTMRALDVLERTRFDVREPRTGEAYPASELGRKLAIAAAWIRARVGVEVLTIDCGGWDHHKNLGALDGAMARQLDDLARGLSAFARDLGPDLERVTLAAWSEFGRRVAENASAGLDHGHGGAMLVLGGNVAGEKVHTRWPTLAPEALDDGDLAITTDARDVLAEIARKRLGVDDLAHVFPDFGPRFGGVVT